MKPIRLELRGFTAFRNEAVVEFAGRHLFAITGPTGAGKSSLLDAMTWALYGQVPRVGNQVRQLMSHGAQAMHVLFEFSVRGQAYQVSRQIGQKTAARLERRLPDGRWDALADRVREVTSGVEAVLGLDYETFTKTVLLPQGAFDAFLRGEPGERREILSGLLGLGRYDQMRGEARARATGAHAAVAMQREQLDRLDLATPEAIAALHVERTVQEARRREAETRRAALTDLVTCEREAAARTRDAAEATQAARTSEQALAAAREALATAAQAATDASTLVAALSAERATLAYDPEAHRALQQRVTQLQQHEAARHALAAAEQAHAAAVSAADAATARAAQAARDATRQQAEAATAATQFAEARATLLAAASAAVATIEALSRAVADAERERAAADAQALAHDQRARDLDALAQQAAALHADREQAEAEALRTAAAAAQAEAERITAHDRELAAETAVATAARTRELAQREHAAEALRRGLAVGDPCPVCGEPITALAAAEVADLDAADAALDAAQQAFGTARNAQRERAEAAATAHARADAARAALDAVTTRSAAFDAACLAAEVTPTGLARTIEEATTAAAAARAQALVASARSMEAAATERALSLLLAGLPPDVPPIDPSSEPLAPSPFTGEDGGGGSDEQASARETADYIKRIEAALRVALDAYSTRATGTRAAEDVARAAAEQARTTAAAAQHAQEIATAAAGSVDGARARIATLGGSEANTDAATVLAALADADARATHANALDTRTRVASEGVASAAARSEERTGAAEVAQRNAEASQAASVAAEALATAAREAYVERWQALLASSASATPDAPLPDERTLAGYLTRVDADQNDASQQLGALGARIEAAQQQREQAEQLRATIALQQRSGDLAGVLELELRRDRFVSYVQREAMQLLAAEAATRMEFLSRGRYRLRTDGDEFIVVDRLNGDERRSVKTLSGGETFLASLALALALSEQLPRIAGHGGALALESLFIDEGFGSLDADALDVAIEALELLASGDRMIGVISHVGMIAERLPDRIEVIRADGISHVL